ncbi:phosphatases II [Guyanagaster necrorhizus]|uniref:protein-tyrosine-phosphatase n=1 Tax=Guyanagaster necrorhizus TaxID=856835 RepID=A0A9P7VWG9_9AGAR|nr:phosphatases II [Guyanagaster necrorhizus MCA 3950]KAG7447822.1 phosphatases II [Guyanagaster necrorhizus MCA 3950]
MTISASSQSHMSANFSEIVKGQLFLGNLTSAMSAGQRSMLGITHIVSVCPEYSSTGPHHLAIAVDDSEYDDLLIHLPRACAFIESALAQGGCVLVHCVMGISRSTTVVAAYLMKTRGINTSTALKLIKKERPCAHPNYGFIKQLDVFADCAYAPSPSHPTYISWKRRQHQNVTAFLNRMIDTTPIIPDQVFLSSEFPTDAKQAEWLILELGVTHVLSLAPATMPDLPSTVGHRHFSVHGENRADLLVTLPDCCRFIRDAVADNGVVLVHSIMESRACIVVGAYLMYLRNLTPKQVSSCIQEALPLFSPSPNFTRHLELFESCRYAPSLEHPLVEEWTRGEVSRPGLKTAGIMNSLSASVLSETAVDVDAFGETLTNIASKQRLKSGLVHA